MNGFSSWFWDFCTRRGLGKGRLGKDGLEKETVWGSGSDRVEVYVRVLPEPSGERIILQSEVCALPFHPARRLAFRQAVLRLNIPRETGLAGFLRIGPRSILFICEWQEHSLGMLSAAESCSRMSQFLSRCRRYRRIFLKMSRAQLEESGALDGGDSEGLEEALSEIASAPARPAGKMLKI